MPMEILERVSIEFDSKYLMEFGGGVGWSWGGCEWNSMRNDAFSYHGSIFYARHSISYVFEFIFIHYHPDPVYVW